MWMAEFGGLLPLLPTASYQPDSATFNHGQWPSPVPTPFSECKAQALRMVYTGDESYRSGKKGMKSIVLRQKAKFSPTAQKNPAGADAIPAALF